MGAEVAAALAVDPDDSIRVLVSAGRKHRMAKPLQAIAYLDPDRKDQRRQVIERGEQERLTRVVKALRTGDEHTRELRRLEALETVAKNSKLVIGGEQVADLVKRRLRSK